jgi:hypothetical protein
VSTVATREQVERLAAQQVDAYLRSLAPEERARAEALLAAEGLDRLPLAAPDLLDSLIPIVEVEVHPETAPAGPDADGQRQQAGRRLEHLLEDGDAADTSEAPPKKRRRA